MLVNLMEHIVTEELDDIPVARLGPTRVACKPGINCELRLSERKGKKNSLRPFIDKPELTHQPHQPCILQLTHQLAFQPITRHQRLIVLAQHPSPDYLQHLINPPRHLAAQPKRQVAQIRRVQPLDRLYGLLQLVVVRSSDIVRTESEDQPSEHDKVFLLQICHILLGVIQQDINDPA